MDKWSINEVWEGSLVSDMGCRGNKSSTGNRSCKENQCSTGDRSSTENRNSRENRTSRVNRSYGGTRKCLRFVAAVLLSAMLLSCSGCTVFSFGENENRKKDLLPVSEIGEVEQEKKGSLLGQHGYCYTTLSKEEQAVYEELYEALMVLGDSKKLRTTDAEQVKQVYNAVMADHPEIFWTKGYTLNTRKRGDTILSLEFAMQQEMSREEIADWQQVIQKWMERFYANAEEAGISSTSSDYEIIKFTFDYLVQNTEYQLDAAHNQTICSVFGEGYSVCQGYSAAMQYLLLEQGIESITISGTADTQGSSSEESDSKASREDAINHAWNYVKADGDWYQLDVTWGDPSFTKGNGLLDDLVNYAYFCVTDADMAQTHQADSQIKLPKCTAVQENYFVREGCYFAEWDTEQFLQLLCRSQENGEKIVSLRFQGESLYQTAKEELIDRQQIFSYLEQSAAQSGHAEYAQLSYVENEREWILTFLFE